ncbi:DUF5676 family membrane protein [Mesobacterium pallidum]|uniref:DUF5676 family membrane protein n=1 Tax=Mesobacterium pallidum TaxID=2872037 RepID=UPI001EE32D88|nr:DUF5676 family membrane protein [Mesobacterium pallidum]
MLAFLYFVAVAALLFAALRFGCGACVMGRDTDGAGAAHLLPVLPLGWALSGFLGATFVICVVFDLVFPQFAMNASWRALLPGFVWLTPWSFILGLVESLLYGWYVALVFGGLYNAAVSRRAGA